MEVSHMRQPTPSLSANHNSRFSTLAIHHALIRWFDTCQ